MKISENYTQYFDDGNFLANKHWKKEPKNCGEVSLRIPNHIALRRNSEEKFCGTNWQWYKPKNQQYLDSSVIVARDSRYPLQRVVGPKEFVASISRAYYLLDMLYPKHTFHHMDLVASVATDQSGVIKNRTKYYWTRELLDSIDIDPANQSHYHRFKHNKPGVGIMADSEWPTFYMYHDVRTKSGNKSIGISALIHMEAIVHDYTHREQVRLGSTSDCPEAEIQALSNQLRLAEAIFNNPGFFDNELLENWKPHRSTERYFNSILLTLAALNSFKAGMAGHLAKTPLWDSRDIKNHARNSYKFNLPIRIFPQPKMTIL